MKTLNALWAMMAVVAILSVGASSLPWPGKIALLFLVLGLSCWDKAKFRAKSISIHNDKFLIKEGAMVYEAAYEPSCVVTRHLCFLHLRALDGAKSWYLPVSRLEFSRESFRQLKCALQCFSMQ